MDINCEIKTNYDGTNYISIPSLIQDINGISTDIYEGRITLINNKIPIGEDVYVYDYDKNEIKEYCIEAIRFDYQLDKHWSNNYNYKWNKYVKKDKVKLVFSPFPVYVLSKRIYDDQTFDSSHEHVYFKNIDGIIYDKNYFKWVCFSSIDKLKKEIANIKVNEALNKNKPKNDYHAISGYDPYEDAITDAMGGIYFGV